MDLQRHLELMRSLLVGRFCMVVDIRVRMPPKMYGIHVTAITQAGDKEATIQTREEGALTDFDFDRLDVDARDRQITCFRRGDDIQVVQRIIVVIDLPSAAGEGRYHPASRDTDDLWHTAQSEYEAAWVTGRRQEREQEQQETIAAARTVDRPVAIGPMNPPSTWQPGGQEASPFPDRKKPGK